MTAGDEDLIRMAREALAPPPVDPPLESIAALRETVDKRFAQPGPGSPRAWRFRIATAAAAFVTLVSGTAAAAAVAGATLPAPLRGIAHGIGLPVDSPGLARAKTDAGRLSDALRQHDFPKIGRDAAALETTFRRLDRGDQKTIDERVESLLNQAAVYGVEQPGGSEGPAPAPTGGEVGGGSGDPTPSTTAPGTVAPVSGSDGGGSPDGGGDGASSSPTPTTSTTSTTVLQSSSDGGSGGSDGGSVSGTSGG